MRFSLASLLTLVAFSAWFLALATMPVGFRAGFVCLSLLAVIVVLFSLAMLTPKDSTGKLDIEGNPWIDTFEPTFKFTLAIIAIALFVAVLLVCFALYQLRFL